MSVIISSYFLRRLGEKVNYFFMENNFTLHTHTLVLHMHTKIVKLRDTSSVKKFQFYKNKNIFQKNLIYGRKSLWSTREKIRILLKEN